MIRATVDVALRFRRLIIALAIGIVALATFVIGDIRQDLLPEFSPTVVEVQTEALGLSAEEVEQFITVPLEQDLLNGVAFLDEIESVSMPGLSSILMTFEPGTAILDARQVVAERLTQAVGAAGLPQVADLPQMLQPMSSLRRVAMIAMSSESQTQIEQSVLARWVVVPRLMAVEGVANVSVWGFRDRQLQVLVDPTHLADRGISLNEVVRTTGNALEVSRLTFLEASSPGTGGFIDTPNQRLHIFHEQAIDSPEQLAKVVVKDSAGAAVAADGEPVTLGDVSTIVEDHQPLIGDAKCGSETCVLLVVEKFPDASTPMVEAGLRDAMSALEPGLGGVQFDATIYRPAEYLEASNANRTLAALIGLTLAAIALAVFEWRTAVVTIVSVAIGLASAVVIMYVQAITFNSVIAAGLSAGALILAANAVTTSRSVLYRSASYGPETGPLPRRTIAEAAVRSRPGPFVGFLAATALVTPLFFTGGSMGAFFPPAVATYLLVVGLELVVGVVVTPGLAMLLAGRGLEPASESQVGVSLRARYERSATAGLTKQSRAVAVFAVGVLGAAALVPTLTFDASPDLAERDLVVQIEAPAGTSLTKMDDITSAMASELSAVSGVDRLTTHIGRAIGSDQTVGVNSAQIWLNLITDARTDETIAAIEAAAVAGDGVTATVSTYSSLRIDDQLAPLEDELTVRVYGEESSVIRADADDIRRAIAGIEGVQNARVDRVPDEDTIQVEVDLDTAAAAGVTPGEVRRTVAMLVSGITVGNLFESQKVFDVVVWGEPSLRETVEDIRNLPIVLPDGRRAPLRDVAAIDVTSSPSRIRHESVQTFVDVKVTIQDRQVADVAGDIEALIGGMQFDLGYRAAVVEGFVEEEAASGRVVMIAIAGAVAGLLLLQAALGSWKLAVIAFGTLPLAATGAVFASRIVGREIGLGQVLAVVATVHLAIIWTVAVVRGLNRRRQDGMSFEPATVVGAVNDQVASIATVIVTLVLICLPLIAMSGAVGLELIGPMAVSMLGGLITTAVLVLYVLPAACLRWAGEVEIDTETDDLYTLALREAEPVGGS